MALVTAIGLAATVAAEAVGGAAGDCEAVWGWLGQPANTVTSGVMAAVGVALARPGAGGSAALARRPPGVGPAVAGDGGPDPLARRLLGVAFAAVGVGSVVFHGPGAVVGGTVTSVGGIVHDLSVVAMVLAVVTVGYQRRDRLVAAVRADGPARHSLAAAVLAFAAGLFVFALSRTDGPWCRPDSILQGHALWHLLVSVAVTALARGLTRNPF